MTRFVPLALAALSLGGCYLVHGRERPEAPTARDASVWLDAGAPIDASGSVDGGSGDAWIRPDAGPIGCVLTPSATLRATDTRYSAHAPELGWDGEQLGLVVFESDGDIAHPIVSAARIAPDLSAVSALRVVGEESHSWGEAAWDPRVGFGLCWNGDPGGRGRTMFRLRDRAGGELAPRIDLDAEGSACEGMARARDRWGAVWRHGRGADGVSMRAAVIDDRGAIVGEPVDLDEPSASSGRGALIAADGEGFVIAVPREGEGIELTRIAADGGVGARALVAAPLARYGAIAVHDDGTVGLAIRDGAREAGGLRFVRLGRDLARLPGETLLVAIGRGVRHPRLAPLPDGWAVLWVEQSEVSRPATAAVLAHLDREGLPLEARRVMVAGPNSAYGGPALLPHDGALYVAIAGPPEPGSLRGEQVQVTRLDCAVPPPDRCAAQDARSSGDDCATVHGFAWDGAGCVPIHCSCEGAECDRVAPLEEECLADHAACAPSP